jgi:hypothetical protein
MTDFETSDRDVHRAIRSWLHQDRHEDASRIAGAVLDQVDTVPQRRSWWPARRTPIMNRIVTIGLSAVVVAVVVFVGAQVFGSPSGGLGSEPTPTLEPTPMAAPSAALSPPASPSRVATFPTWYPPGAVADANGAGTLSAGSHATRVFSPGFTFTAPEGWVNAYDEPAYFTLFPDTPANQAEYARSDSLAQHIFMGLHSTPWFTCDSLEDNRGATAAEMLAAASANEALAVSEPVDVSIGGLTGKQVDVRRNPDWTGTCAGDADLPEGVDPADERIRGIWLDVPGRGVLIIMLYSTSSAEHDAFLAEAMPIIESFQFNQ